MLKVTSVVHTIQITVGTLHFPSLYSISCLTQRERERRREREKRYISSSRIGLIKCLNPLGVRCMMCIQTICDKLQPIQLIYCNFRASCKMSKFVMFMLVLEPVISSCAWCNAELQFQLVQVFPKVFQIGGHVLRGPFTSKDFKQSGYQ